MRSLIKYISQNVLLFKTLAVFFFLSLAVSPVLNLFAKDKPSELVDLKPGNGLSSQIPITKEEQAWLDQKHAVRVRVGNVPPYHMSTPEPEGISVDYLKLIGKRFGINFSFVTTPFLWQEALDDITGERKSCDILATISRTPEREKSISFTQDYIFSPYVIINRTDSAFISRMQDLNGKSVAVERGFAITDLIKKEYPQIRIASFVKSIDALRAVATGESDAYVGNLTGATYLIQANGLGNLKVAAPTPFGTHNQAMGVRKDWPELVSIINKAFLAMPKSEENEIRNRWLSIRYEHGVDTKTVWNWIAGSGAVAVILLGVSLFWNRKLLKEAGKRKVIEDHLRIRKEKYRNLFNNSEIAMFRTKLDGSGHLNVNQKYLDLLGVTREETIGKPSINFWADLKEREEMVRRLLAEGSVSDYEFKFLRKSEGSIRHCLTSVVLYRDEGILEGSIKDITGSRKAEEALRNSEAYFRTLFDNSFAGVMVLDKDLYFTDANKQLCSLLEYSKEELTGGMKILDLLYPDDLAGGSETGRLLSIKKLEQPLMERRYITKSGKIVTVLRYVSGLYSQNGEYIGAISSVLDITHLKQIEQEKHAFEQQMQHTQKLESLGVLAGGIAHDFNNILAIIIGYCGLTKMDYDAAEKNISEIEKAAERAAALCRQMLAYAGKATLTQTEVNIATLVDEMVAMLKTTIKQNVVIKPELETAIPTFTGDASQLRQVAMNLIINAAEAIGDEQGEVHVSLTKSEIRAGRAELDQLGNIIPAGQYICLEVADNGCGMDEETQRRIFEPFYTTKFTGRGLGMSAVLGIIKAHHGALQLESRLGQGTTFKVYLPVQPGTFEAEEAERKTATAPWKGSGTILLAEDEEHVKHIARALIEMLGFTVLDAANGKEALELYQLNAADITLVVTDLGMPIMNGYELFYKLKQLDPQLPIIVSSGFGEGDIASKIPREAIAGVLNKPYNVEQMREVLQGVVDGG